MKAAVLEMYNVNWQWFQSEDRKPISSFNEGLADQSNRWEKMEDRVELRELVLLEEFLQTLFRDMVVPSERRKAQDNQGDSSGDRQLSTCIKHGRQGYTSSP